MKIRKNLLFICIVALVLVFGVAFNAEAAADKARAATLNTSPTPPGGISDVSSGDCVKIDDDGRMYITDLGGHTIASQWGPGLVYTGACVVYDVIVRGQADDDYAAVYDATSATGTAKLDPQSSDAKKMEQARISGAVFSTGIYVHAPNADVLVTIVYDTL